MVAPLVGGVFDSIALVIPDAATTDAPHGTEASLLVAEAAGFTQPGTLCA